MTLPDGSEEPKELECACHFGETTESDGGGGDCSLDHACPEATPNCTGYVYDMKWGKCTIDGVDPYADYESEWRESYSNTGYNFEGYDTQGATASPPVCASQAWPLSCVCAGWLRRHLCSRRLRGRVPRGVAERRRVRRGVQRARVQVRRLRLPRWRRCAPARLPAAHAPTQPPACAGADIGECYTRPDAADYRGLVQKTIPRQGHPDGITCQTWSHQVPQTHTRSRVNFPDAGLGGHNACRNPDGNVRAWCFTANAEVRWDYCDIGTPQLTCNSTARVAPPKNITHIDFNTMYSATARESQIKFFVVPVPRHVKWAVLGHAKPRRRGLPRVASLAVHGPPHPRGLSESLGCL